MKSLTNEIDFIANVNFLGYLVSYSSSRVRKQKRNIRKKVSLARGVNFR